MEKINKILLDAAGLSDKETAIYLALLELGQATVMDIAKKADLKRTTVYNLLPDMIKNGLVSVTSKKKKKLFFVEDVKNLKNQLENKEKKIDNILPQLQAMHNLIPLKPKITFYEGKGGFKKMVYDLFDSCKAGDTVLSYIGVKDFHFLLPPDFAEEYWKERVKRKIRTKVIAPRFMASEQMKKTATSQLREIKLINDPNFSFQAGTEIYANKVALMSYREGYMGVIIESKEIHNMQKCAFNLMWDSLD